MEVRFAAKKAMKKHQGSALSLPIEDIVGQADWAVGKKNKNKPTPLISLNLIGCICGENYVTTLDSNNNKS